MPTLEMLYGWEVQSRSNDTYDCMTMLTHYVSRLAWEGLGVLPDELDEVTGPREVWVPLLRLLPPRPDSR